MKLLTRLPKRFHWTLHNVIAHPLAEILFLLGFKEASSRVHDVTVPPRDVEREGVDGY